MLLVLLALTAQVPDSAPAARDTARPTVVYYGGKHVVYYVKKDAVVLRDSAWVRYGGMSVYSDSIVYDVKLHRLTATRDVLFNSGSENVTGALLVYDIDSRKGMMRTARTKLESGFFRADEVWLVKERVLNARRATYTTCPRENPHYVFYGPRSKLLMDDVAIAEPVIFKVGGVPLLAAPFWLVPVGKNRKSGLLPFKVGNSQTEGLYAKDMAYYWVINDYADMTFYADFMTKKGLQGRVEGVYIVNPYARGNILASYIREWDTRHTRYSISGNHSSKFFFGSDLDAQADFMSDRTYVPDYSEEELDWLKQDMYSYAHLSRSLGHVGSVSASVERKQDFVQHNSYTSLPSARLSLSAVNLPGDWYFSPSASFSNRLDDYADSTNVDTSHQRRIQGGAAAALSSPAYPLGSIGSLTFSDNLGFSESKSWTNGLPSGSSRPVSNSAQLATDQSFGGTCHTTEAVSMTQSDELADSARPTAGYRGSVSGQVVLYRVYSTTAFGMKALRHSATPGFALNYEPRVDSGGIFGRPHLLSPADALLSLSLANTFQAKLDTLRKRDLGSLTFNTGYDLVAKRPSPLAATLGIDPLQGTDLNLRIEASAGFDLDSMRMSRAYSVNTAFYWSLLRTDTARRSERGFQVGLNHTIGPDVDMLTGNATVAIPGWKLVLGGLGYNFKQKQLADYSLTLTKDLCCWEAMVSYRRLGSKWTYDFDLHIKQLPSFKIGRSTFGSLLPNP